MQSLENWYSDGAVDEYTAAQEAYQEGFKIFASELSSDPSKLHQAESPATLATVREAVLQAQSTYIANKKGQKIKDRLGKLVSLLSHYGNIIEVFAQHHPEYVALAWGAIKLLLVSFLNHEATISTLTKSLCQIAQLLPRVELTVILYPTSRLRRSVAELYAYIIKFLVRAREWFQEGWLKHVWHSVSRPVSLQYGDLLEEIKMRSDLVEKLALAGSQAEQRVMHRKMDSRNNTLAGMHAELQQMREMIISLTGMIQGGSLQTNLRLDDLQLRIFLESLTETSLLDPNVVYKQKLVLKTQSIRQRLSNLDLSWTTRMLTQWSSSSQSSILLLKNTWDQRFQVQYLLVSVVELLKVSSVPVLWVLEPAKCFSGGSASRSVSTEEVLKSLIAQALQLPTVQVKEALGARICAQLQSLTSDDELLTLFGSIICQIPAIYLVIDAGVLEDRMIPVDWPQAFNRMFQDLSACGVGTRLKVLIATRVPNRPYTLCNAANGATVYVPVLRARPEAKKQRGGVIRDRRAWRDGVKRTL
ncbi:hypothetical protein PG993_014780 [Apiospora rasikravindrae]|uniref:DUF7708 domain-containing protein n=1 Tax=Apiospora rasikravindrae TaxID=990691 RepID=A0ABR1RNQ9_9PEZI